MFFMLESKESDPKVAIEISKTLEIIPSWNNIFDYMTRSLKPEMSRQKVYSLLEKIGSYRISYYAEWENGIVEEISFTEGNRKRALGIWHFEYDKNDRLIYSSFIDGP
jgi:hypothetical protein